MSITSGYNKYKRYTKLSDGTYKLVSQWTNSNTVEMDNGSTLQATLGNTPISGIGDGTVTGAIDSLNSNTIWKSIGTTTGVNTITLPNNWTELKMLTCKTDEWNNVYDKIIYREDVYDNTDKRYFHIGYYGSSTNNMVTSWAITSSTGMLAQMFINGTNYGYNSTTYWYYR